MTGLAIACLHCRVRGAERNVEKGLRAWRDGPAAKRCSGRTCLVERPVEPRTKRRYVVGLDRRAAPDAHGGRRIAVPCDIKSGSFGLKQARHLLDEGELRVRIEAGDRGFGKFEADAGVRT